MLQELIPVMSMLPVLTQLAPLPVRVIQVSLEMGPTVKVSLRLPLHLPGVGKKYSGSIRDSFQTSEAIALQMT